MKPSCISGRRCKKDEEEAAVIMDTARCHLIHIEAACSPLLNRIGQCISVFLSYVKDRLRATIVRKLDVPPCSSYVVTGDAIEAALEQCHEGRQGCNHRHSHSFHKACGRREGTSGDRSSARIWNSLLMKGIIRRKQYLILTS